MLAQVVTNEVFNTAQWVAQGVHHFVPSLNPVDVAVSLLTISKAAQLAYKHWTTDGSWADKLCKKVGVVQEPASTVVTTNTILPTLNK